MMHTLSTLVLELMTQHKALAIMKSKTEQKTFKLVAAPDGESGVKF